MSFNLRFHRSKDFEARKAGKLAIWPYMSCRYTKNTLMEQLCYNVSNWYPYAWNLSTGTTLVNIKSSSSLWHTSRANNEDVPWVYYCKKGSWKKKPRKAKTLDKTLYINMMSRCLWQMCFLWDQVFVVPLSFPTMCTAGHCIGIPQHNNFWEDTV